ncbi:transglutaminase-like domain-containing protein [Pyrolobus fumarii]|nr:transglutaminase-like domain-containing protein [Pyrolobus fumarii]
MRPQYTVAIVAVALVVSFSLLLALPLDLSWLVGGKHQMSSKLPFTPPAPIDEHATNVAVKESGSDRSAYGFGDIKQMGVANNSHIDVGPVLTPSIGGDGYTIQTQGEYLVVGVRGVVDSIAVYEPTGGEPILTIYPSVVVYEGRGWLGADVVTVNNGVTAVAVKTGRIMRALQPGSYKLVVWSGHRIVTECNLEVGKDNGNRVVVGDCRPLNKPTPISCSERMFLAYSLYCATRESEISVAYSTIHNARSGDALWSILAWLEKNREIEHSENAVSRLNAALPSELLSKHRGARIDYAVLTAVALLGAGFDRTYLLVFPYIGRAAAAVELNNTVFVLDKRRPPIELQDYIEYLADDLKLAACMLSPRLVVCARSPVMTLGDTWPGDTIPAETIEREVNRVVERDIGGTAVEQLSTVTRYLGTRIEIPPATMHGAKVPVYRLYTPAFHHKWVEYIAEYGERLIREYGAIWSYFWIDVTVENSTLIISAYGVPFRPPHVDVTLAGDTLVIDVEGVRNPQLLNILVYNATSRQFVATILPPSSNIQYENIANISAGEWRTTPNGARILVPLSSISEALGSTGNLVLMVVYQGDPVYAFPLG